MVAGISGPWSINLYIAYEMFLYLSCSVEDCPSGAGKLIWLVDWVDVFLP